MASPPDGEQLPDDALALAVGWAEIARWKALGLVFESIETSGGRIVGYRLIPSGSARFGL